MGTFKLILGLGAVFLHMTAFGQVDSLKHQLSITRNDSTKTSLYLNLSQYFINDSSLSMAYVDSALMLSQKNDHDYGIVNSMNTRGRYLLQLGHSEEALQLLTSVVNDYPEATPKLQATTFTNIGLSHYQVGNYDEAINWHHKSIAICEKLDLTMGLARGFNNLGIAYQKIKDWEQALVYHQKSLKLCEANNIEQGIAYNLGNIGIIFNNMHLFDSALIAHEKSVVINKKLGNTYHLATNYNNLAAVHESLGNMNLALENYEEALKLREQIGDKIGISTCLINIASAYLEMDIKPKETRELLEQAVVLATEINAKDILSNAYLFQSRLSERQGQYKLALERRKEYEAWKDSTVSESHLSRISEMEMKYESQKKENEILALSKENLEKQAGLESQEFLIRVLIIGIIALVMLVILLFIIYKQYLSNEKQQATFRAITDTQETERIRIARDLHDSVGIMLTAVKHKIEQGQKNGSLTTLIDDAANEVRRISHNMMPGALLKYGLNSAVEQLLTDSEQSKNLKTSLYTFGLDERLDMSIEIGVYRILQELVQNIIKHAEAENLTLHINRHPKNLNIIMEDDGKGIGSSEKLKADGIGLKNIRSRIAAWKGKFAIDSKSANGTTVLIDIPLAI